MMLKKTVVAVVSAALAASAASAGSASLAAPGDCAQPIRDLDTGPIRALPTASGVSGPPAAHFAPVDVVGSTARLLPLDLTRTLQTTPQLVSTESQSLIGKFVEILGDPLRSGDPDSSAPPAPSWVPIPDVPVPSPPLPPVSDLPLDLPSSTEGPLVLPTVEPITDPIHTVTDTVTTTTEGLLR